jgi:hypothetical protein
VQSALRARRKLFFWIKQPERESSWLVLRRPCDKASRPSSFGWSDTRQLVKNHFWSRLISLQEEPHYSHTAQLKKQAFIS